ncbi:Sec20 [Carpediemonas membranifera]|uniref:Sec20 n=1 Tax=Carpediemonas membranifera TaxID=201153 RepID=A0A8J6E229_9EUKA|nr:Sec20 [Carpediemonas membranifera]|eukprot:KAG9394193.1 Sec20 [Carpediemonas membranifera]
MITANSIKASLENLEKSIGLIRITATVNELQSAASQCQRSIRKIRHNVDKQAAIGFPVDEQRKKIDILSEEYVHAYKNAQKKLFTKGRESLLGGHRAQINDPLEAILHSTNDILNEVVSEQDGAASSLVASTDVMRATITQHSMVHEEVGLGRKAMAAVRWADVRERLLVFVCFFLFAFSAIYILYTRLMRPTAEGLKEMLFGTLPRFLGGGKPLAGGE